MQRRQQQPYSTLHVSAVTSAVTSAMTSTMTSVMTSVMTISVLSLYLQLGPLHLLQWLPWQPAADLAPGCSSLPPRLPSNAAYTAATQLPSNAAHTAAANHSTPSITPQDAAIGWGDADGGLDPLLTKIDVTVKKGQRILVLGPNGAGKSTLMKMMAGQLQPWAGSRALGDGVKLGVFAQDLAQVCAWPAACGPGCCAARLLRAFVVRCTGGTCGAAPESLCRTWRRVHVWPVARGAVSAVRGCQSSPAARLLRTDGAPAAAACLPA